MLSHIPTRSHLPLGILAALLLALSRPGGAMAAEPSPSLPSSSPTVQVDAPVALSSDAADGPAISESPRKSQNVTINLINRLVERGVLSKEDAAELIKQAEEDALEARAQMNAVAAAVHPVNPPPPAAGTDDNGAMLASIGAADPSAELDDVRVQYIPETVKAQLREEIKQEVLDQAREERWAAPRSFPEWVARIHPFADLRVRWEGDYFPEGNDNTGAFPNFNAINTGPPFDITGTTFSPQLNVDQDRTRARIRLRFGAGADLGDNFTAGVRIATGETNSPVSTNQSLGIANNAQGGNFSRYAIWLDRGFVKYEFGVPTEAETTSAATESKDGKTVAPVAPEPANWRFDLSAWLGRFDNPWFATDLIWDDDVGFDGLALQARYQVRSGITPFATAGVFPIFNTDFNFSSNRPDKFPSEDKWLVAEQIGVNWRIRRDLNLKVGLAYYDFKNIRGRLSDPFVPLTASDQGNTDNTRPAFAQKGNTYFAIRNIFPVPENNFGTIRQFQYFGLATPFRDVAVTGVLTWDRYDPVHVWLTGEWIQNTAFDWNSIDQIAVNNRGPSPPNGQPGPFVGGDTAWLINLKVGKAALEKLWDWNAGINYRYIESDAVVDGFNDSDFGLGGTNLKGYEIYGNLGLTPHVFIGVRWLSSDEIAGPKFSSDILQLDFNARF